MNGDQLRRLREANEWSQGDLATAINTALGDTNYGSGSISPWERGKRNIPERVQTFLEALAIETNLQLAGGDDASGSPASSPDASDVAGDTAPGPGGIPPASQPIITATAGVYAKACEELWEIIGAGIGMVGAATGSEVLMVDGQIIVADKQALGQAWGRLAETNDTFRKMLVSMTEGGAWLQVAIVTGTTVAKVQQNHAAHTLAARASANGYGFEPAAGSDDAYPAGG